MHIPSTLWWQIHPRRTEMGHVHINGVNVIKYIPWGSIFDPLLFNELMDEIFYVIVPMINTLSRFADNLFKFKLLLDTTELL